MDFHTLTRTWRGLKAENRFHRLVVAVLLLINLLTLLALVRADRTVVLVPPILEGEVNIARDSASRSVVEAIKRERVAMQFSPDALRHDQGSDTFFVTGQQVSAGPGAEPVRHQRTYEIQVGFQHYRPVIRHLDVYPGGPRTTAQP